MTATTKTTLDYALEYASIGWKVFPVSKRKKPLVTGGLRSATLDTKVITNWWTLRPDAGIGVATGIGSGIVVLDIDAKSEGADALLQKIVDLKGEFAQNVVSLTGGGGYHFFFRHPANGDRISNAQGLLGVTGVDVRGDGGYVVVPPSPHVSGKSYQWSPNQSPFDQMLSECPDFLYNSTSRKSASNQFAEKIPQGERNATLASIAGLLRSFGLEESVILQILLDQNSTRCDPPLGENEVKEIARAIVRYPAHKTNETVANIGLQELLMFDRSDTGFGQMLAMALIGQIKYNHTQGKWLLWGGHFWKQDETEEITLRAIDIAMMYKAATDLITDADEQYHARKYANLMQSKGRMDSALTIARAQPSAATTHLTWNQNPDLIAAKNGVLNLKTGEFRDGKPDDFISSYVNTEYDPEATCPMWEKFLGEVFENDSEIISFVQRALGYSMTAYITEQCMFLLVGGGSNGKSTLLDVVHGLAGRYGYAAPFSTFERTQAQNSQTNDIAALADKRLVISSEPNEGVTFSEARIKSLTGGEPVAARFLHQEFFEFHPKLKIWLGVNHLPRVLDDSDGFWRRVKRINFPVKFVDAANAQPGDKVKDLSLMERLKDEYPGILNWIAQGAARWYKEGLRTPDTVASNTTEYRKDSDPLDVFLSSRCFIDPGQQILADDLFKAYLSDSQERMLKTFEIMGSTRFHQRISRLYTRTLIDNQRVYIGIGLQTESKYLTHSTNTGFTIKRTVKNSTA